MFKNIWNVVKVIVFIILYIPLIIPIIPLVVLAIINQHYWLPKTIRNFMATFGLGIALINFELIEIFLPNGKQLAVEILNQVTEFTTVLVDTV